MSRGFVKDGDQEEIPIVSPRAFLPKGMTNYVTVLGMEALQKEKEALLEERCSLGDMVVRSGNPSHSDSQSQNQNQNSRLNHSDSQNHCEPDSHSDAQTNNASDSHSDVQTNNASDSHSDVQTNNEPDSHSDAQTNNAPDFHSDVQTNNETDLRIRRNYLNAKLELLQQRINTAVVMDPTKQTEGVVGFGAYVTYQMGDSAVRRTIHITGADEADIVKGYISYFSPLATAFNGRKEGEYVKVPLPTGPKVVIIISVSYTVPAEKASEVPYVPDSKASLEKSPLASEEATNGNDNMKVVASHPIKKRHSMVDNLPFSNDNKGVQSICDTGHNESSFCSKDNKEAVGTSAAESDLSSPSAVEPLIKVVPQKDPKPVRDNANEVFPIVNERGIIIGRALRWQCHDGSKLLHPVVHLHVFNSAGDLYLQRRPQWKDIQPGKWDTAVGGHVGFGEQIETALRRETQEELGITDFTPSFIKRYVFESPREKELVHAYKTIYDAPITPSSELDDGRFWSREEILATLGKKIFTPNFESEYKTLFK